MRNPVPAYETLGSVTARSSSASTGKILAFVPEPLLDTDEAAAVMRIHPKTLQKMARRNEIHGIRIGKHWRFRAADIQEWIDSQ